MNDLARELHERFTTLRTAASRITPATVLVRGSVSAFALLALLVADPTDLVLRPSAVAASVVLAAAPAVAPRTRLTTVVIFVAVLGWLAATTAYAEPVTWARLVTLACLLYLLHTTAALAAVLPYDTVVSPMVLAHWLTRTVAVLAVTAVFAVAVVAVVPATGDRAYLLASVVGLLLVAALVGLLALRRR
jgi:LPXTG-motif cell wall-anchored protein